ncbi:nitrogen fixation protein NifZ, partial [Frankia sp. AiPs1]|uniref:nitrogen fixation protein NifZ n=1 Tax=Frankia sp. AiPs1 TaxID=573493 RepID=UPI002043EFCD
MTTNTYDVGDVVMAAKALRNDGTYPDPAISIGEILVEAGTRGQVINVGLYLQEHIVYAIAFENGRIVGALERELEAPEDATAAESAAAETVVASAATATAAAEGSVPVAVLLADKVPAEPAAHGAGGHAGKACKHGSANCKSAAADAELAAPSTPAEPAEAAKLAKA